MARSTAKRSSIIIETGPHVCIEIGTHATIFLFVKMASEMDHGRCFLLQIHSVLHYICLSIYTAFVIHLSWTNVMTYLSQL